MTGKNFLTDTIYREFKRQIVRSQITCPITGKVLDVRTAKFSVDSIGDPQHAFAPEATEQQIAEWLDAR